MTPGITTPWEHLMTGLGVAMWVFVAYTVYNLSRSIIGHPGNST